MNIANIRNTPLFRLISLSVLIAFIGLLPTQPSYAQVPMMLPPAGQLIHITRHFEPPQMLGIKIDVKDPFSFSFIMDQGEKPMNEQDKKEEFNKIIKYFLVSLTVPNKQMWVNLSPYESNRIIPEVFGQTEMGRDLLAQDYVLKQFTASLMYPEDGLGKQFWAKVYQEAQSRFGTTDINVNTFNKVWIVADKADVYQKQDTAFLVGSHLKVMLEQDYLALEKSKGPFSNVQGLQDSSKDVKAQMASQIVREIIIPAIENEVNEGKSFALVRQVYNAEIMATWFKRTLRQSLLAQVFANRSKIAGQKNNDPEIMERIYKQYLKAYKKGVFNYIKEDPTPDGQMVPRKYFSGGAVGIDENVITTIDNAMSTQQKAEVADFAQMANSRLKRYSLAAVTLALGAMGGAVLYNVYPSLTAAQPANLSFDLKTVTEVLKNVFQTTIGVAGLIAPIDYFFNKRSSFNQRSKDEVISPKAPTLITSTAKSDAIPMEVRALLPANPPTRTEIANAIIDQLKEKNPKSYPFPKKLQSSSLVGKDFKTREDKDAFYAGMITEARQLLSFWELRKEKFDRSGKQIEFNQNRLQRLKDLLDDLNVSYDPEQLVMISPRDIRVLVKRQLDKLNAMIEELRGSNDEKAIYSIRARLYDVQVNLGDLKSFLTESGFPAQDNLVSLIEQVNASIGREISATRNTHLSDLLDFIVPLAKILDQAYVQEGNLEDRLDIKEVVNAMQKNIDETRSLLDQGLRHAVSQDDKDNLTAKAIIAVRDNVPMNKVRVDAIAPIIKLVVRARTSKTRKSAFVPQAYFENVVKRSLTAKKIKELKAVADQAQTHDNVGGINLSDENLTLNVKIDGEGMPLPIQLQDKIMMNVDGITSIIRNITPITPQNVPALYVLLK